MQEKADINEMRNELMRLREMLGNLDPEEKQQIIEI